MSRPRPAKAEYIGVALTIVMAGFWATVLSDVAMVVLGSPGASVGRVKLGLAVLVSLIWWFGLPWLRKRL